MPLPRSSTALVALLTLLNAATSLQEAPRAVQIIAPDASHSRLVVMEENLVFLRNVTGRMGFVGVVGPFHSGKSFLMNQLLPASDERRSSLLGFKVGPTVQPETRGIWMWTEPIVIKGGSGVEDLYVYLLDTEGLYASNVSESYDAKIFAVATLLSSTLVYNTIKIIDQAAIDSLEFLVRRSQLFALRAELQQAVPQQRRALDFRVQFPSLLWVVEDFFQDLQGLSATEWLHQLLLTHKIDDTNKPSSLLKIFPSVDCRTIFLPHTKRAALQDLSTVNASELTPEFRADIEAVRNHIAEKVQPKQSAAGTDITGAGYVQLIRVLVKAANEGSFPSVPSVWRAFVQQQVEQAKVLSVEYFKDACQGLLDETGNVLLPSLEDFTKGIATALSAAKTLYSDVLVGLDDAPKTGMQQLLSNLDSHASLSRLTYDNNLRELLQAHATKLKGDCESYLKRLHLPLSLEELNSADNVTAYHLAFERSTARWKSAEQWKLAFEHFKRDTDLVRKTVATNNKNEIDRCLEAAAANAKAHYLTKCVEGLGDDGACGEQFEEIHKRASATVADIYAEGVPQNLLLSAALKSLVQAFQASAEASANDKLKTQCQSENTNKIRTVLDSIRGALVKEAKADFAELAPKMPLLEEEVAEFGYHVQARKLDAWKLRTEKCYRLFSVWATETEALQKALAAQTDVNIQLNVAQYLQTVAPALARARERIKVGTTDYWFDFRWRSFAEGVVREELSSKTNLVRGKVIDRAVKEFIQKEQATISGQFWPAAILIGVVAAVSTAASVALTQRGVGRATIIGVSVIAVAIAVSV